VDTKFWSSSIEETTFRHVGIYGRIILKFIHK
jgi:hypothetical protein